MRMLFCVSCAIEFWVGFDSYLVYAMGLLFWLCWLVCDCKALLATSVVLNCAA